jgi:hypothetical protein
MAKFGLGPKAVKRLQEMSAAERARNKNPTDPAGTGAAPVLFAPCIVRITETIAARSSNTPGSGDADMWLISDGTLEQNAAEATKTVYNLSSATIVGTTTSPVYATAVQVRGGAFILLPGQYDLCAGMKGLTDFSTSATQFLHHVNDACPKWIASSTEQCGST